MVMVVNVNGMCYIFFIFKFLVLGKLVKDFMDVG